MAQSRSTESNSGSSGFRWLCTSQVSCPSMANTGAAAARVDRSRYDQASLRGNALARRPLGADPGGLHALDHRRALQLRTHLFAHGGRCHRRSPPCSARGWCAWCGRPGPAHVAVNAIGRPARTSVTCVRLSSVTFGRAAVCSSRMGSRYTWLMRCGGSGVGHQPSGPAVSV
jgi:hypothetical protein